MLTLSGLLEGLERDPGVVAFSGSEPLSSHDFLRRVGQFRHLAGPRKEKRWGLYLQNPFDFAACFLALLQAGKVPVILPNSRPSFCEQISDELDAVIADSSIEGLRTLCLNDLSEDAEPNHGTIPKGSRLALFTSGSTGRPKKVEKSLFNIASELQTLERVWGTDTASSTFLSTVSHQHIYGLLFQVLWPLCSRKPFDTRTYSLSLIHI